MAELPRFDAYINGASTPPSSGEYFETINPYTSAPWAMVARCNEADANAAIEAAKAGAAIAHVHVRDPDTGQGSRNPKLFKEAVDRIRDSGVDVVLNLTAGMGGDWVPDPENPHNGGPGTDMIGPEERLQHVVE